eukprot:CAMPEP_0119358686 /NCGR_PEP_ID=MMETSP1334-20130426/6826_1 /TAXON_ID=127549 /ORGANISM="Calcidiscus leptoporus, Strain RCC1130" /LENGTH=522 /DNA_ID=CAMNT_0007373229 /DNA_START=14 /DNA_END=1579 /DNA_ORIENTATION=+
MASLFVALISVVVATARTHDAPIVLTVAGSDSGGGAGIQADIKTCEALGVFATTAIVALTAQNTKGVQGVFGVPKEFVREQIDSVADDMGAHVVKTGMLPTAEAIEAVAAALDAHGKTVRVIDPVFVAASGDTLVAPEAVESIRNILLPSATVLTPNMHEAGALLGRPPPETVAEMREAASALLALGARSVVLKGGRLPPSEAGGGMVDIFADTNGHLLELRHTRYDTPNTHGTGCTLAAAIAAEIAKQIHAGAAEPDILAAVRSAREYLSEVLETSVALRIGAGARGPLNHARAAWAPLGAGSEGVSAALWGDAQVQLIAADCRQSGGFVAALADGSLPKDRFAGYVAQDKFFLEAFAQAYAIALSKLPPADSRGAREFAALVKGVVDELQLHAGYAAQWGVSMEGIAPVPECLAYVTFLREVAASGDVPACAAAMVPCMRLYAHLGQTLQAASQRPGAPSAGPYAEWIATYAHPGFEELAATLESLLDRYAAGVSPERFAELRALYVRAMELELDFFQAW